MSLDVYLYTETPVEKKGTGVFIRDGGETKELTIEEVKRKWPDAVVEEQTTEDTEVFWKNITHNLGKMAGEAGIYKALWRPEEIGIFYAKDLYPRLRLGLALLKADPDNFKQFNPENGWGNYEGLVKFVEEYLQACKEYPDARIGVSR